MRNYVGARPITISDFDFKFWAYGKYVVTYTSPVTRKRWSCQTNDMPLIDCTKNSDDPTRTDLVRLRRACKLGILLKD